MAIKTSITDSPTVSVLMTAYNREEYIYEAIESLLATEGVNFELIITDDGSTDDTVAIAKTFAEKDSRIQLYINDKNLGDYANRNKAASYAKGKYITFLDSDDYYHNGGLAYIVDRMEKNPDAQWAIYDPEDTRQLKLLNPPEAIQEHFFVNPFLKMGPGGTILKRDFFEKLGGYPEKYGPANDMYFDLKAGSAAITLVLNKNFFHYRRHEGQEMNNVYAYLTANYEYLRDALAEIDMQLTPKQIKWLQLKNKRRFVVNLYKFYRSSRSWSKTKAAWEKAKFSVKDALQGIFHW